MEHRYRAHRNSFNLPNCLANLVFYYNLKVARKHGILKLDLIVSYSDIASRQDILSFLEKKKKEIYGYTQ